MRFSTTTLGCKANQYDTETIAGILLERGHEHMKAGNGCDVCIINTCAVTAESVRKSKQAIRRLKTQEPAALIAVCGCFSELDEKAVIAVGADLIGGTRDRETFALKIEELADAKTAAANDNKDTSCLKSSQMQTQNARTRALLKIQDGCDNHCAYCVIPTVRGGSRSVPQDELIGQAKVLQEQGYKEIVITGIEILSYKPNLMTALRVISNAAPNVRLRMGSLDPRILTDSFIEGLCTIPNLCDHFHISLQSGCDETLRRMQRGGYTEQVLKAIDKLRELYGNCGVTADVIVGFPGESDTEFEQTLSMIKAAGFSAMHIFPFSPRPSTKALSMPDQVDKGIIKERAQAISKLASRMSMNFKQAQVGKTLDVIFETRKGKYSIGHSGNYLSVAVYGKIDKNTMKNVKISSIKEGCLIGEIV